jgi:heat shock protein HslJ
MRIGKAALCVLAAGLAACAASPDSGSSGANAAKAAPSAAPASLVGTRWKGVDASVDERHLPWLEFVVEGRVSGYTGCNLLHGAWRNESGEVRFGPLVTTKRACAGPEGEVERRVLAALNGQSRVTREGDRLTISAPGAETLHFVEAR